MASSNEVSFRFVAIMGGPSRQQLPGQTVPVVLGVSGETNRARNEVKLLAERCWLSWADLEF